MTEEQSAKGALTRRNFLKTAGALTAFAGVGAAGMTGVDLWLGKTNAHAAAEESVVYTFHQNNCGGHCSFRCTTRDGRLALIQPNETWPEERFATVCVRGLSEIQNVYSAERIQTPLKRVGERGEGQFVSISWDEALDEISSKLKDLWDRYGKQSVLVRGSGESKIPLLTSVLGAQAGGYVGIDCGIGNGLDPSFGYVPDTYVGVGHVMATNEPLDWVNSKTIVLIGTNFLESSAVTSRCLFEAKEAGAQVIVIDPHFSTTASKATQWIQIEPGTDAALLLCLISIIIDSGWYDEEFMKKNTSFPFLVNKKTGKLLREHETDPNAKMPETGKDNPFLVWDTISKKPVSYLTPDISVAIEGSFKVNEDDCTTVFSLLKDKQKKYTVDWCFEKTGIEPSIVNALAEQYATRGPASLGLGWGGPDKFTNSDILGHAAAVLVGLTGNIGIPGGSVGGYVGWYAGWYPSFASWPLPEDMIPAKSEIDLFDLPYKTNGIKAFISFGDIFQQYFPDRNSMLTWLKTLEFILYCDVYHTSGADWADIVLPVSTKLENTEKIGGVKTANGYVLLQSQVIEPLFESKPDFWIENKIAESLGLGQYMPKTAEELVKHQLENSNNTKFSGITLDKLIKNKGIMPLSNIETPRRAFTDQVYGTASQKLELYYEVLLNHGQELPEYEEPNEAYRDNPKRDEYPIQLHQSRPRFRIHSQFFGASWINQLTKSVLEMNSIDMNERGIETGDIVEVYNDRGSFSCSIQCNESIRPGSARFPEGTWAKFFHSGTLNNVTNPTINDRQRVQGDGPAMPFNDTLVEVKKA